MHVHSTLNTGNQSWCIVANDALCSQFHTNKTGCRATGACEYVPTCTTFGQRNEGDSIDLEVDFGPDQCGTTPISFALSGGTQQCVAGSSCAARGMCYMVMDDGRCSSLYVLFCVDGVVVLLSARCVAFGFHVATCFHVYAHRNATSCTDGCEWRWGSCQVKSGGPLDVCGAPNLQTNAAACNSIR